MTDRDKFVSQLRELKLFVLAEIDALQTENKRLRDALQNVERECDHCEPIARKALKEQT